MAQDICDHDAQAIGQLRLSTHDTIVAAVICEHCSEQLRVVTEFEYRPAPRAATSRCRARPTRGLAAGIPPESKAAEA